MPDFAPSSRPSLTRLATRGALWTGASQYLLFGLGIVKTILLARLIGREYFGLLAIAGVWASYFAVGRLELRVAVFNSNEESKVLHTQFLLENLSMLTGLIAAGVAALLWPSLVPPGAWPVVFILLLGALFETLSSTPAYLIEKRLRQDVLGRFNIFAALVGLAVPLVLAWGGAAMTALLADLLLPVWIPRLGAWLFIRWRPALIWDWEQIRKQWRLGWTLWTTGLLGKITFQFDDFLVGNFNLPRPIVWMGAGVVPEALYSRAYNVGKMPMDVVAGMIGSMALSLYAESAARGREVLAAAYRRVTWILTWIIFFSSAAAFVTAGEVVYVLGEQWVPMAPLFRLMCLFVVGRPLFQNNAQLLLAMRAERDFQMTMLAQAAFILVACPPAVYFYGAAGASVVVSLMSVIGLATTEWRVAARLNDSVWRVYLTPAAAAVIAILAAGFLSPFLSASLWLAAVVKGAVVAAVFGAAVILFDRRALQGTWDALRRGLRPD